MSLHRNNVVTLSRRNNDVIIDLIHKYHNAQVPHPTMHHFVTEMCTCVHFFVAKWCIVGHLSNALWDLWDGSIALSVRWDRTTLPLRPRLHYIKHTVHWLHCSGCWFHLGSAYLHIINFLASMQRIIRIFCQQCHPSVVPVAEIMKSPRPASYTHLNSKGTHQSLSTCVLGTHLKITIE